MVANGSVFVASDVSAPDQLRSFDLFTGEQQWTRLISPPPVTVPLMVGGDHLFLPQDREDDESISRALTTADGSELWTSEVNSTHVTPLLDVGLLTFREDSDLVAVDARTGEECWRSGFADRPRSSAVYGSETVVVNVGTDGSVIALDAKTGDRRWEADISDYFHPNEDDINDAIRGHIVAGDDRIFVHTFGGLLIALDANTGETDWATPETHPEMIGNAAPPELEPVAFSDGALLVIESDRGRPAILHAIDPTTGDKQWTFEPETDEDIALGSAAVAGEMVFLPVADELHLLDLTGGDVLETHGFDGYTESAILANGICLVTTTEGVVALEEG
nr:PQQ-binding-like beta-propeller repeat protein [Halosolutus halophilus]